MFKGCSKESIFLYFWNIHVTNSSSFNIYKFILNSAIISRYILLLIQKFKKSNWFRLLNCVRDCGNKLHFVCCNCFHIFSNACVILAFQKVTKISLSHSIVVFAGPPSIIFVALISTFLPFVQLSVYTASLSLLTLHCTLCCANDTRR